MPILKEKHGKSAERWKTQGKQCIIESGIESSVESSGGSVFYFSILLFFFSVVFPFFFLSLLLSLCFPFVFFECVFVSLICFPFFLLLFICFLDFGPLGGIHFHNSNKTILTARTGS